jgi:hypothetical protein
METKGAFAIDYLIPTTKIAFFGQSNAPRLGFDTLPRRDQNRFINN